MTSALRQIKGAASWLKCGLVHRRTVVGITPELDISRVKGQLKLSETHSYMSTRNEADLFWLESLPFAAFIVDSDYRVLHRNQASFTLLGSKAVTVLQAKGGVALNCLNVGDGCGQSDSCRDCIIRTAVASVTRSQAQVTRRVRLEIVSETGPEVKFVEMICSPLKKPQTAGDHMLLVLQDVSQLLKPAPPAGKTWKSLVIDDEAGWSLA